MKFAELFPAGATHVPVVYFLQLGNRVKIGTSTTLASRARSLSLGIEDVRLIMFGGDSLEKAMHDRYAEYRLSSKREWFEVRGRLRKLLDAAATLQRHNLDQVVVENEDRMLVGSDAVVAYRTYADLYIKTPAAVLVTKKEKRTASPEEVAAALAEYRLRTEQAEAAAAHAANVALTRAKKVMRVVEVYGSQRVAARRLGLDQSTISKLVKKAQAADLGEGQ